MSTDKLLHRIQLQIHELTPTLELFVDDTVQPSVHDCETLQKSLVAIQENLAVYKYNKQNKELSPSFNIHARLSEKQAEEEKKTEIAREIQETVKLEKEETKDVTREAPKTEQAQPQPQVTVTPSDTPKQRAALSVGINDKFRFMNELFAQNSTEYNVAMEQINTLSSWHDAEIYLNSLKHVYGWDEKSEVYKYFFGLVKKRFD